MPALLRPVNSKESVKQLNGTSKNELGTGRRWEAFHVHAQLKITHSGYGMGWVLLFWGWQRQEERKDEILEARGSL